ncbi:hypothetical protein T484DRAFT_1771836, partial [Baffinella frigidus]
GYSSGSGSFSDLWVLHAALTPPTWEELHPTGAVPDARSQHLCAASGDALFNYGRDALGGAAGNVDLRKYNVTSNEWSIVAHAVEPPGIVGGGN